MQNRPRLLLVSSTKIIVAFVHNGGSITTWPPISRSGFEFSSNFPSCGAAQSFVELYSSSSSPTVPVHLFCLGIVRGIVHTTIYPFSVSVELSLLLLLLVLSAASGTAGCSWRLFGTPCCSTGAPVMFSYPKPRFSSGRESLAGIAGPLLLLPPSWLLQQIPDSNTLDAGGARGCSSFALMATTRFLGKLSKTLPGSLQSQKALQLSSPRLPPCWDDTVLNDRPLVYDQLLALAHPGQMSAHPNCWKSALRGGARRTCRNSGSNGGEGTAACGCNTGALIPTV